MSTSTSASNAILKTYTLRNQDSFTGRRLEFLQNNQPILWVNKKVPFMGRPTINIQTQSENGPIVASCRFMAMGSGLRILIGQEGKPLEPDAVPKENWWNAIPNGMTNKEYEFRLGQGRFVWRRTRDSNLGASSLGGMDFKLLDLSQGDNKATQRVLAVYVNSKKFLGYHDVGRVDFMVELGQDLELMALATVLGIEERIRRRKKGANAGAAGGAGA